jgi:DNA-binding XRE family transcriptional regulator
MSGHKNFRILREKLEERLQADPEARLRVEEYRRAMRDALALADLRESRGVTQAELADVLEVSQANVSRVEHKDDLYLSTLSKYVAALGGRLELTAVFPDQTVRLMVLDARESDGVGPLE